jgi:four helix bundle protein
MATILIIDDDPTTLSLMRTRLEKAGYKVREATDGQEGLKIAERERPNLVFVDVRMPKMDGWQVCRTIKSNPALAHCPVVILTGCSQDAQELYGLQCGADEYVTKPWDGRELMRLIKRLLEQSVSAQDARSSVSQQRVKQYVQRVVRLLGALPNSPNTELMSGQLLRLSTSLVADYESAVRQKTPSEFRLQISRVEKTGGEVLYWLGLLHDSKTCKEPDLPLVIAESKALQEVIAAALGPAQSK